MLVANHQSLVDILALYGLYRPFKWVSKASVFKAPIIGWNMRLNRYIALERGRGHSIRDLGAQKAAAHATIAAAKRKLDAT